MKQIYKLFGCVLLLNIFVFQVFGQMKSVSGSSFLIVRPGETPENLLKQASNVIPAEKQVKWQERELIAFAHFGMNTFTNKEWGEGKESPELFNPTAFDARQWVSVLKNAGVKLLILTAKHHDGFCLWPSKYTKHSVKKSPWKKGKGDVVKEVSDACRESGMAFGIYLSPWDRTESVYGDSPRYNEYFLNQLRELLTNYGEISEVWFDGACGEGSGGRKQIYDWGSYYRLVRELQPKAVIFGMAPDVRWVGNESGVGRETEWSVVPVNIRGTKNTPGFAGRDLLDDLFIPGDMTNVDLGSRAEIAKAKALAWYPAETDVSIRPGWFYHPKEDSLVKTPDQLVDIYYNSVGRNSLLLLNVPPDTRGLISDADIKSLQGMRRTLDQTFRKNFAEGLNPKVTEKGDTSFFEYSFPDKKTFDVLMLKEDIRKGQHIEKFKAEAWDGAAWKIFAEGTTVGYKRLMRTSPVTADKVRLVVTESRAKPELLELGLFKRPSK